MLFAALVIAITFFYIGRSGSCSKVVCPKGSTVGDKGCVTLTSKYCPKNMAYDAASKKCVSLRDAGFCPIGETAVDKKSNDAAP